MGGGRGGVVREVGEHSSVALAAVNFLSFPMPLLRLCLGKIKIFTIFVSFKRFCCPLAVHYHFRVIHNNFVYLAPIVSPPPPYCPFPLPPIVHLPSPTNLPFRKLSVVKFHWMALQIAAEIKTLPINFFLCWFNRDVRNLEIMKIKGLLEPAHSCYDLGLHWFLGLAE